MFIRESILLRPKSRDFVEVEKEVQDRISAHKQKMINFSNDTLCENDIHTVTHTFCISDSDGERIICIISFYNMLKYKSKTIDELQEELSENLDELEELEDELEELEDIDEDDFDEYDIESEEEYKENLDDLKTDILILKDDIDILEMCIYKSRQGVDKC